MHIKLKSWLIFLLLTVVSLAIWYCYSYPQFSFLNLSINRNEAVEIANAYLSEEREVDPSFYLTACVFSADTGADRYLQKTLGFKKEQEFIQDHDISLFNWYVRFFQENKKEEYHIHISASTGDVISFTHVIAATDKRETVDIAEAKQTAIEFLKGRLSFNPQLYSFHSEKSTKRDNRIDYSFNWEKNNVYVTWSDEPDAGGAKLLTGATVSGQEILSFKENILDIPEKFSRSIKRQRSIGSNITILFAIIYFALLAIATYIVITRRHHLCMHVTKNFFIALTVILFSFGIIDHINHSQDILIAYTTTTSMASHLWRYSIYIILSAFYITVAILMPGLSGESLRYEVFPQRKEGSFLYFLNSTILTRRISEYIIFGYTVAAIMLGIQSVAFYFGRSYLGVWTERPWITELSTAYLPFLTAFFIGFQASFVEEITFRILAISLFKKVTKRIIPAVIIASVIWGFGHSHYPVFPQWFRGIEVTLLGLFLSFVYIRFGLIPVLVGHYVFDVFWSNADYLFGTVTPFNFYSALIILLLPLGYSAIAYTVNKPATERKMRWKLNKHQIYNLEILKSYLRDKKNKTPQEIREELISHGWDIAVIEKVFEEEV